MAINRMHFIDPAQDVTADADRVLVFRDSRSYDTGMVNTIVEVQKRRHFDGHRLWYITKDGYYVQGAPINPASITAHQPLMGIISDDLFVVGVLSERTGSNGTVRIIHVIRSDRRTLGGTLNLRVQHADTWVKAAPWATRLLPLPTDGVQAGAAKLALAEQLYINRRAQVGVYSEALQRGYMDDVQGIDGMPTPLLGAMVKGSAFLPVHERLSEGTMTRVTESAANAADSYVHPEGYAMVDLSFMYPADAATREELDVLVTKRGLSRYAAEALNDGSVIVGDTNITPVLRNLV